MKLSQIQNDIPAVLEYPTFDEKGKPVVHKVSLTVKRQLYREALKNSKQLASAADSQDAQAKIEQILPFIKDWDITDDNGETLPLVAASLENAPPDFILALEELLMGKLMRSRMEKMTGKS